MSEANQDKEFDRQTLSRLASSWSKVSKFTLQYYADAVPVTRSNLYAQVSDPDNGKRLGIDALIRAAFVTGVQVADDGQWYLVNGHAQQWPWKKDDAEDVTSIQSYLKQVHERLGAKAPFKITEVNVIRNRYYQANREYALIEITDRAGNEMSSMIYSDSKEQINIAIQVFLDSGVCEKTSDEIVLSPEMALQLIHGPIPKPQPVPAIGDVNWNEWMPMVYRWHLMGYTPQSIDSMMALARGVTPPAESKKNTGSGFAPGSETEQKPWGF